MAWPGFILAAAEDFNQLLVRLIDLVELTIPILIGLALLFFLSGVAKYGLSRDDNKRRESISVIIFGLIALFAMVSVWGLVNLLSDTFNLQSNYQNSIDVNSKSRGEIRVNY